MIQFWLAIFLSAFLLFQVQPIIARYILPWYGGSPAVWTACLMFFQVGLLCGYLYAHLLANRIPARRQPILHLSLLGLSLLLLPISPPDSWTPTVNGQPAVEIFVLLAISIGIPFVLISASAPLLQHWFSGVHPGKSPFRLYALSNLGSLIALLSYPIVFEPQLTIDTQANTWSVLYLVLAALFAWCGYASVKSRETDDRRAAITPPAVSVLDRMLWMALAACGSMILVAVTNQICQDVAVVPFLWILPLSLYLISFIICFDKDTHYHRGIWMTLLAVVLGPLLKLMFQEFLNPWTSMLNQIGIYCLALFACCMICHGELARRRSAVPHLTTFYLYVALGGALGGTFVNLVAPVLFEGFWELHVALAGTVILAGICIGIDKQVLTTRRRKTAFASVWSVVVMALVVLLGLQIRTGRLDSIHHDRGFFGVMFVYEWETGANNHERAFYHGSVQHGRQAMHPSLLAWPSAYYGVNSGIGAALLGHPRRQSADPAERGLRVGVVGLGVGTLSAYGTEQDSFRYYEINPQVEKIADEYFSYLKNSKASTEIILGDARISLERELLESGSNEFDVLVLDAFSGDAIPVHLLTEEAFDLFAKHLRSDGILALHTTNQFLDLSDVVRGAANHLGKDAIWVEQEAEHWFENDNDWVLVTDNPVFKQSNRIRSIQSDWHEDLPRPVRWTDDFSNLFQVIVWD